MGSRPAWSLRLRPVAGRLLERAMRSGALPFELRARLYWRRCQGTWIARRQDTFKGKLQWKLLKDRRPLITTFADRVAVRDYVARVAGPQYLTECLAVVSDPGEIVRSSLPREFVAKSSHGSGGLWIVSDRAPQDMTIVTGPDAHGPVWPGSGWNHVMTRPEALDWELFGRTFRAWLSRNYSRRHHVEWPYLNVPPRLIVEELLGAGGEVVPDDYKLFVFNGRPRVIHHVGGRFSGDVASSLYTPDWRLLDADWPDGPTIHPRGTQTEPPAALAEMLEVAAALGRDTDFVRVDLYDVDGRVVFGELTNIPGAATTGFVPEAFEREVGSWWSQPASYRSA